MFSAYLRPVAGSISPKTPHGSRGHPDTERDVPLPPSDVSHDAKAAIGPLWQLW